MDIKTIRENAKEKLKGFCRVCPQCNGIVCAGEVPGMGGSGTGSSFISNIEALGSWRFNMRTIHDAKSVNTGLSLFGIDCSLPVLAAPMTGISYNCGGAMSESEFIDAIVTGSLEAGSVGMTGDGADPSMYQSGIDAIKKNKGRGIPIIKPRAQEEIIRLIKIAEDAGAPAVGMDIDGAGLVTMALKGQPVGPKTPGELEEIIGSTKLPFILKGIMTPDEATAAYEAGAKAIVVSNHGGRILDFTPGVADVLPEIAEAVSDKITVLADGGVRSGADVLKYIALGAHAVLIGRPLITAAFGGGKDGVAFMLNKIKGELSQSMILTGTKEITSVDQNILFV
jgi:isopentenyl diphosphate isomerase/L-lactate dehydrogenase-like FMN-dependent dehydrogenase